MVTSVLQQPTPTQRLLLAFGVAFLLLYAAGLALGPSEDYLRVQSNLIYVIPAIAALVLVLRRVQTGDRVERVGWWLMAAMLATWIAGDLTYAYYEIVRGVDTPFPSIADAFYTAGYASLLIALPILAYPRRLVGNLRWLLDVLLITTVVGSFEWVLIIKPILDETGTGIWASILALSYPLWDLGLIAIIVGAMLAWPGGLSPRSRVLLAAMATLAIADTLYSYGLVQHGYDNLANPLELAWIFAYMLIGLATTMPGHTEPERFDRRLPVFWMAFPYLLALPLPVVVAVRAATGDEVDVLSIGAAAVLLMAFLSHVHGSFMSARALEAERRRARVDSLTGALNHGGIVEEGEALLRLRPKAPLFVCLVDVDGLKHLNDGFGHRIGDETLKVIAHRLGRTGGIVGRYGGDEFLVLFEADSYAPADSPEHLVSRALTGAFIDAGDESLPIGASFGLALYPDHGPDLGALIERADQAMYEQKRARSHLRALEPSPLPGPKPAGPRAA